MLLLKSTESLAFYLWLGPSMGPGFCHGRLSAAHTGCSTTEKETGGRPCNTYLKEADGEERRVCGMPLPPPQEAPSRSPEPAAPKSDFHTSSHPRMSYPSGKRKQSIKQVRLYCYVQDTQKNGNSQCTVWQCDHGRTLPFSDLLTYQQNEEVTSVTPRVVPKPLPLFFCLPYFFVDSCYQPSSWGPAGA